MSIFKQNIVIVILMLLVAFATSSIWFFENPILLSFEAKGVGDVEFRIFCYKNDRLSERVFVQKNVNLSKTDKIDIEIYTHKVKSLRLNMDNQPANLAIFNMSLQTGEKHRPIDLAAVDFANVDEHSFEDGVLKIKSLYKGSQIIIKLPKEVTATSKIDIMVLFVVLLLSYLFFYQLVGYLAGFKIKESHSRIDIVFVCFFIFLLFVPMSRIDKSEISNRENRTLAKYSHMMIGGKVNPSYGKDFEAWFNDRFWGRKKMIWLHENLYFYLQNKKENNAALWVKDGWLFSKAHNNMKMYQNDNLFSDDELVKIADNLLNLNELLKKNGAKLYILLSADKESLYGECLPYVKLNQLSRKEQLEAYLHKFSELRVVSPVKKLQEEQPKGELLFCKTGTHMTDYGGFLEYLVLMEEIGKDFPDIKPLGLDDFNISKTTKCDEDIKLNFTMYNLETQYLKLELKNVNAELGNKHTEKGKYYTYLYNNPKLSRKMFIMGDSFVGVYINSLAETFGRVFRVFYGSNEPFELREKDAEFFIKEKPEIVVVETTERFLQRLLNINFDILVDE